MAFEVRGYLLPFCNAGDGKLHCPLAKGEGALALIQNIRKHLGNWPEAEFKAS